MSLKTRTHKPYGRFTTGIFTDHWGLGQKLWQWKESEQSSVDQWRLEVKQKKTKRVFHITINIKTEHNGIFTDLWGLGQKSWQWEEAEQSSVDQWRLEVKQKIQKEYFT